MTINALLQYGKDHLLKAGIDNAANEAWYFLEALLKKDRTYLFLHGTDMVDKACQDRYTKWITKRMTHYPMQYILGEQPFMDSVFYVNEDVLIPRQETELLVMEAFTYLAPGMDVLDMCCGSGCIGLSLAKRMHVNVTLADISKKALAVADENKRRLFPDGDFGDDHGEILLLCSDVFDHVTKSYDMIVSNPPYIRTDVIPTLMEDVRDYEPLLALDGSRDGLYFYRKIVKEAGSYLNENAHICFEIGYDQGEDVRKILVDAHYRDVQVKKDLAGLDRVVTARKGSV